jgi:predicted polyphosphate/ATP-dependent NAD kinase
VFTIGLIINPIAGLGGSLANKGSDSLTANSLSADAEVGRAAARAKRCLVELLPFVADLRVLAFDGEMGGELVQEMGFEFISAGVQQSEISCAEDTIAAAEAMVRADIDLLLFVGGDGTARDIHRAVADTFPALGIPAGVKMHSGVYAVSPEAAAEIILHMLRGGLVDVRQAEVRDIDEKAFRENKVKTRYFGELMTPSIGGFLQRTKVSGREDESLVKADIAAEFWEMHQPETLYLLGPGSTTMALLDQQGLTGTLLGVDVLLGHEIIASDVGSVQIMSLLDEHQGDAQIVLTAIGGQGHILGRGNQQFSPEIIRRVGEARIMIVATKSKIAGLEGQPLLVDSNDLALDEALCGYRTVICGYRDQILYRVSRFADEVKESENNLLVPQR